MPRHSVTLWNIGDTADTDTHLHQVSTCVACNIMLYLSLIHVHKSYNDTDFVDVVSDDASMYNVDHVHVHACIIMLLVDVSSEMNC